MKHTHLGFTLIEMMISVAVLMVMVAVAVPQFQSLLLETRLTTESNRLLSDIQLARSEAIKRQANVLMCPSSNPEDSNPSCDVGASDWSSGWLVFANTDTNTAYNNGVDVLLNAGTALRLGVVIKTNSAATGFMAYNPDGTLDSDGNTARFALCDERGEAQGRQAEVTPVGRPEIITPISSCSSPT